METNLKARLHQEAITPHKTKNRQTSIPGELISFSEARGITCVRPSLSSCYVIGRRTGDQICISVASKVRLLGAGHPIKFSGVGLYPGCRAGQLERQIRK